MRWCRNVNFVAVVYTEIGRVERILPPNLELRCGSLFCHLVSSSVALLESSQSDMRVRSVGKLGHWNRWNKCHVTIDFGLYAPIMIINYSCTTGVCSHNFVAVKSALYSLCAIQYYTHCVLNKALRQTEYGRERNICYC